MAHYIKYLGIAFIFLITCEIVIAQSSEAKQLEKPCDSWCNKEIILFYEVEYKINYSDQIISFQKQYNIFEGTWYEQKNRDHIFNEYYQVMDGVEFLDSIIGPFKELVFIDDFIEGPYPVLNKQGKYLKAFYVDSNLNVREFTQYSLYPNERQLMIYTPVVNSPKAYVRKGFSKYTDRDSVIEINGNFYDCFIFHTYLDTKGVSEVVIEYISKDYLFPFLIISSTGYTRCTRINIIPC